MTPVKQISLLLLIILCIGCSSSDKKKQSKEKRSKPSISEQQVEQATFTSLSGDTVSVKDFKGKVVMIDFWETWCKPCIASFPTVQKLKKEYPDDFAVLAVTPGFQDTRKDAQAFVNSHDYDLNFLLDTGGLSKKLRVQGIPFKVFVDARGRFIKKAMGSYGPRQDYRHIKEIIEKYKGG